MRLIITEEEKDEIINKYKDNTDDKLLVYLKRHFPIHQHKSEYFPRPFRFIQIDDKSRNLDDNKKYLVNRIFNEVEDVFTGMDKNIMRRTIKYYIDINRTIQ
jgi:hypothetical protein